MSALREANQAKDGEIATLRDVVGGLRDTVTKAEARADGAETAIAGQRQRADALRDCVVTAEVAQREAEEEAGRARRAAGRRRASPGQCARKPRGCLRRVLAAWGGAPLRAFRNAMCLPGCTPTKRSGGWVPPAKLEPVSTS